MRNYIIAFAILFITISCSSLNTGYIAGTIESFGTIDINSGKKISISPSVKEDADSLEFMEYKKLLSERFNELGLIVVENEMDADYWAFFGYQIATKSQVGSVPVYGNTGVSSATATTTGNTTNINYNNSFGVIGSRQVTYELGDRLVAIDIYDGRDLTGDKPKKAYELLLRSSGNCKMMYPVMPFFIQAIFENFPDNRGSFYLAHDMSVFEC